MAPELKGILIAIAILIIIRLIFWLIGYGYASQIKKTPLSKISSEDVAAMTRAGCGMYLL